MRTKKDEIINILNMELVLNKYGIKLLRNRMFSCPFHKDKNPSAKCYNTTFYCFSCNKTGDLIQFVQYLFNLSFKEAMAKIIDDFQLPIKINAKYDKQKILELQKEKMMKIVKELMQF